MLIFVSIILVVAATDNLAILVSSSVGYYNYRQGANLLTVYQHLKANGFSDQDIILMMPENPGCCDKNPIPGSVSFIDGDYTNINVDLVLDRRYSEFNLKELYDVLRGKYDPQQINLKRLTWQQPVNLFLYVTGHGGDSYFKLRERQAIINKQFARAVEELYVSNKYINFLAMSDSCGAATLFDSVTSPNFLSIGSSSEGEKSLSHGHDTLYNSAKSDDYTFYLKQFLESNTRSKTVGSLHSYMTPTKLKVNAKYQATHETGKRLDLDTFMKRRPETRQHLSPDTLLPLRSFLNSLL